MKKFFQRILLGVAASSVLLLVACGGNEAEVYEGPLKIYGIASGVTDDELNDNEVAQMIREYTNEDIEFYQAPSVTEDAQTALINIFTNKLEYHSVQVTKELFYTLLSQDALLDITEYIDSSTNLKDEISETGWNLASSEGQIYGIPNKDAMKNAATGIAYRVDFLEMYNNDTAYQEANNTTLITVPSEENFNTMTLDNFKVYLQYVTDKQLVADKAFRVDTNAVFINAIMPAFGVYSDWADINGELTYAINQPGFEEYSEYMQSLYTEGLLSYNSDGGENGVQQITVKADGEYIETPGTAVAVVAHWNASGIETAETDDSIGYISVLVENEGDHPYLPASEGYGYITVIPKYTDEATAQRVIEMFDKKLDEEFFVEMIIGEEGVHYTIEDGDYYPILPTFDERNIADKFLNGTAEENYTEYWQARVRKTDAQAKMFFSVNVATEDFGIKNPIVVMPPNETYDAYQNGRDLEVKTQLVKLFYGSSDALTLTEIQDLYNTGSIAGSGAVGEEISTAVNEWYKTWSEENVGFNPTIE